jgi:hypothetical protein
MHTSRVPIILYKSYSVATRKHSEPISLGKYARIVDFTLYLRAVYFNNVREFLLHSFTIEMILLPIRIKELNLPFKALLFNWRSLSASWLL